MEAPGHSKDGSSICGPRKAVRFLCVAVLKIPLVACRSLSSLDCMRAASSGEGLYQKSNQHCADKQVSSCISSSRQVYLLERCIDVSYTTCRPASSNAPKRMWVWSSTIARNDRLSQNVMKGSLGNSGGSDVVMDLIAGGKEGGSKPRPKCFGARTSNTYMLA